MSIPESAVDSYPLSDLNSFRRDVLRVVASLDEPHGLAIKAAIEHAYEVDEINHSRLYPSLDDLHEKGLVEKGQHDERTNSYSLTARGRRELDAHRSWFNTGPNVEDDRDSVQCVLCDETSETPEDHEQHMEEVHNA